MIDINRVIHKLYTDTTTITTLSFLLNHKIVYKVKYKIVKFWQKIKMRVLAHRFGEVYGLGIDCFLGSVDRYPKISHGSFLA